MLDNELQGKDRRRLGCTNDLAPAWHRPGVDGKLSWLPELKKRGRPASAVADGHELAVQSFIFSILQIEGQRYKAPPLYM